MDGEPSPAANGRRIVRAAAAAATLIGAAYLALWLAGVPPRWSALGAITMKTNMAVAQVLAGVALLLLRGGHPTPRRRTVALFAAAAVLLIGGATLVEHVTRVDLGIDQLVATEPPGQPGTSSPNRMGPPGALSLVLLGAGLLSLASRRRAFAWLGFAAGFVVLVPAVGMVYRVDQLYENARVTVIAWPTVISLLLLALGLGVADLGAGSVPVLWRRDPGGVLLRRMAIPAVLAPLVIGYVRILGERNGLYDRWAGTGLFAVSLGVTLFALVWRSAAHLSTAASERKQDRERATAELRRAAELLELGDAFLELDATWHIVRVNANQEALSRTRRSETVGRTLWEVFPDIARPDSDYWREYHRCMEQRVPVQFQAHYAPLDMWTGVSAYPTRIGGIAVFFRDITQIHLAQLALRASEERLRTLADAMPQLVWTARPDGTVDYYNCRSSELAGLEPLADGSYRWAPVIHPNDRERTIAAWQHALATGETYQVEHRVQLVDRTFRWFLSRGVPARDEDGRIVRWYGTATDIQPQKEAQHALEEADRRKDDFLGMLSHELRNPLAPIRNALYILDRSDPTGPQARRAKDVASRQLSHLTRLVDDLLDVTRIARGKIALRRAEGDLAELVRRVAEDHRALLRDRGVALAIDTPATPVTVHADDTRIAQVLGNLLQNAAKFTPAGGTVTVAVGAEGRTAVVKVRDTGVGIERELLPSVFEPFVQAKQTLARSEGGLGLGLALVKGLVAAHGGEVTATSEGTGRGAEFVVRLPLARSELGHAARAAEAAPRPSRIRRRVLVVDDNRDAAESLAELVALFGHDVEVAFDGPSALAKARGAPRPDVVLCDLGLPGMDGYAVARELRSRGPRDVRLIAVSGYAQPEDVTRASEAGFDGHVAKPPEPGSIERILA